MFTGSAPLNTDCQEGPCPHAWLVGFYDRWLLVLLSMHHSQSIIPCCVCRSLEFPINGGYRFVQEKGGGKYMKRTEEKIPWVQTLIEVGG